MVTAPHPLQLLQQFRTVQQLRAEAYSQFSAGFLTFLRDRNGAQYRALISKLTADFQKCSASVRMLENALIQVSRADLAAILRSIQELERRKLQLTLNLQVWRVLKQESQGAGLACFRSAALLISLSACSFVTASTLTSLSAQTSRQSRQTWRRGKWSL